MISLTTLTAMLLITDNPSPFVLHEVYPTYEACSEALLTVGRDAVCIGSEEGLERSPRPRPNPFYGDE